MCAFIINQRCGKVLSCKNRSNESVFFQSRKVVPSFRWHPIRQQKSKPIMDLLVKWLKVHPEKVSKGSKTENAINFSLKRWALSRYFGDDRPPIDNNWVDYPTLGFGTQELALCRQSAQGSACRQYYELNSIAQEQCLEPFAYLKDVLGLNPRRILINLLKQSLLS